MKAKTEWEQRMHEQSLKDLTELDERLTLKCPNKKQQEMLNLDVYDMGNTNDKKRNIGNAKLSQLNEKVLKDAQELGNWLYCKWWNKT